MNRFRQILYTTWIALMAMCIITLAACQDEAFEGGLSQQLPSQKETKVTFKVSIPGLKDANARAAVTAIDERLTQLDLYLFDADSVFTGIVSATAVSTTNNYNESTGTHSETEETYTATIPGNTLFVHFLGNYTFSDDADAATSQDHNSTRNKFVMDNEGRKENQVITSLTTTNRVYWGRETFTNIQSNVITLYRNYAKVSFEVSTDLQDQVNSLEVLGWTLVQEPTHGTAAPFNTQYLEDNDPNTHLFDYTLTTATPTLPAERYQGLKVKGQNEITAIVENEASKDSTQYLFEYIDGNEYSEKTLFAIFKIKAKVEDQETTKYYKIALLEDTEKNSNGTVIRRTPFDIVRNYEYKITFKGIEPQLGGEDLASVLAGAPANNASIDIEKTVPEVESDQYILRIENGTIRYYNDVTADKNINDILVYFGKVKGTGMTDSLEVMWEEPLDGASNLNITPCGNDSAGYFRISFDTKKFEDDNKGNHYREGLIRVRETHDYLLSRFVRVYIGDPISFRPLLISSDIPAVTNERLTILFEIPDTTYLPSSLYPIEVRFGSDRVDVEKNMGIDAMKVEFDNTPYNNVLQYTNNDSGDTYGWYANKEIENKWGYKYVYTINRVPDATEKRKRVTLRTTNASSEDFSVVMEGMSTVTGTAIFNKRELEFKMQDDTEYSGFNRILINNGMPETRMVTGYINETVDADTINVIYTLGEYDEEDTTHPIDTVTPTVHVTIWAYYNPEELTPITEGVNKDQFFKDAEGNFFIKHHHAENTFKDTIRFIPKRTDLKNSVVFLTARNKAENKYNEYIPGYYEINPTTQEYLADNFGTSDYLYTGVNKDWTFRSASAIISLVDKWNFNPAPSTTGVTGSYTYANEASVDLGTGKPLYLRIDQPLGSETVQLKFEAPYLALDTANIPKDSKGNAYYTINSDSIITLASNRESDYCYLRFKTTTILNACTLKMSSTTGSTVQYNDAEISITNSPVTFQGFEFASEDSLAVYGTDLNSIKQVRGALHIVRVLLPNDLADITQRAGDEHLFSFKMTSNNFDVIEVENNAYDDYTSTNSGRTHIVYVDTLQTQGDSLCYVDLVLKSKKYDSAESLIFSSDTDEGSALAFYRYISSMKNTADTYPITIQHSLNQDSWTDISQPLYNVNDAGTDVYYKISLPNVGYFTDGKYFDFTFDTDSLEFASIISDLENDSTYTNANDNLVYRITPNHNQTTEAILQMKTKYALTDAITVDIDPGETVKAETVTSVLKSSNQFSSIQWYATAADAEAVGRGTGVWGSSTAPYTLTNNKIEVSDFAKELHLTLKGISGTSIDLSITGDYAFKDGTTNYTVAGDSINIVLVPTEDKNIYDGELIDGSFTITGISGDVSYATPSIEVDIRPWVVLSTNVGRYTSYAKDSYHGVLIPYGYEYIQSYKRTDAQHATEDISIRPYITWNPEEKGGNGCLVYDVTSNNGLSDWNYGSAANYNSFADNTSYEFKWRATVVRTPVHAYQPSGNTDVMLESESGNFIAKGNIWYPYTDESGKSFTISRLRPLSPFMNDGKDQGYIQYSTDGTTWNNILGDQGEADPLHAELDWYSSGVTPTLTAGTTFYMRITIPSIITDDEVNNIAVKNGTFTNAGIVTDSDGSRWVKFSATAPADKASWDDLQFYDTRISSSPADTEIGSSAKFDINFKAEAPKLKVELLDSEGNNAVNDHQKNYYVGQYIYLRLTASTLGAIPFKLEFQTGTNENDPKSNNNSEEYLEQVDNKTTLSGFTLNTNTFVKAENGNESFVICYKVKKSGSLRFKATSSDSKTMFTLKGSDEISGVTHSIIVNPTNTYDYYCLDASTKTNTLYKDGVAISSTLLDDNRKQFTDNVLTLTANQQTQGNQSLTVKTTPVGATEEKTLVSTKVGQNQTTTIEVPYPMKVTIIWAPRTDKEGTGMKIVYPDNTSEIIAETENKEYTKIIDCPKGTLKIERGSNEFWLYYIKLEPNIN